MFRAEESLRGTFRSKSDKIDYKRHKAHIGFRPAKGLINKVAPNMKFLRHRNPPTYFYISDIYNMDSTHSDNPMIWGNTYEIKGKGLKVYYSRNTGRKDNQTHSTMDFVPEYKIELSRAIFKPQIFEVYRVSHTRAYVTLPHSVKTGKYHLFFTKTMKTGIFKSNGLDIEVL